MVHPAYAGCWQTEPLANLVGLAVDQVNFIGIQFMHILFGLFFHWKLQPPDTSPTVRHIYCLVLGLFSVWLCNGWETWHLVLQASICYLMMNTLPAQIMHVCVLLFSLGYLVTMTLYRYLLPEEMQFLDITFPCTMAVQKLSSLAFSITDHTRYQLDNNCLTEMQKKRVISKPPNLLEFYSYIFSFQGILGGPFSFYNDYKDFIEGRHISSQLKKNEKTKDVDPKSVSPMKVVFFKTLAVVWWIFTYLYISGYLIPTWKNADLEFIASHGIVFRLMYMYVSLLCHRSKYYLTWMLADAVFNASGFGFNGVDDNGNYKWDLVTNVRVEKIETATSFKTYIDNWNIQTIRWLRYVCYERAPFMRIHLTYFLSAVWHGVYPGFYMTFLSATWFTLAGRKIRKNIRPLFQETAFMRGVYEVITWFGTQVPMGYIVLPFIYNDIAPFITFYNSVYWCFHFVVAIILIIPITTKARKPQDSAITKGRETTLSSSPLSNSDRMSNGNSSISAHSP